MRQIFQNNFFLKGSSIVFAFIVFAICITSGFFLSGCDFSILKTSERILAVVKVSNKKSHLNVVYFSGNATVISSIQVHRQYDGDRKEYFVANYDYYDQLDSNYFLNDSVFVIVMHWSGRPEKIDTMQLVIKEAVDSMLIIR